MKKVELVSLRLLNFKGIREQTFLFNGSTNVHGANATGKSTIFDAFTWNLFGKDQQDRKDHQIKTLDKNNEVIWKLDHEVEAVFMVNGSTEKSRRVYKENWERKRGTKEPVFTGHDVLYFWNDVPVKAGEYAAKVNEIINESMFKLLTNTLYFNNLHWTERRKVLLEIAGKITDTDIFNKLTSAKETTDDYSDLIKILEAGKSANEYKKQLAVHRLKLKAEMEKLPERIGEAERNKPESFNWNDLAAKIAAKQQEVDEIDKELTDAVHIATSADSARIKRKSKLNQLEFELRQVTNSVKSQITDEQQNNTASLKQLEYSATLLSDSIKSKQQQCELKNDTVRRYSTDIEALNQKLQDLREKWAEIDGEVLVVDQTCTVCPTCKQLLPENAVEQKLQEIRNNFNLDKVKRQKEVVDKGTVIKDQIASLKDVIDNQKTEIQVLEEEIKSHREQLEPLHTKINTAKLVQSSKPTVDIDIILNERLKINEKYLSLSADINVLKEEIEADVTPADNDLTLKKELKKALLLDLDALKKNLANKDIIEKTDLRIEELQEQEKTIAQEIADTENMEFKIDRYTRAKMDILESRINDRFKYVTFKLFERQINGGEVETCECLVNGVPFSAINTAARINAGIDIINVLSEHYQVSAPIFIDNRESITEIIPTQAQVINLIVNPDYNELHVTTA